MQTVQELKTQAVVETPLLLLECTLPSGAVERWSTHRITVSGHVFEARVLKHNLLEFSTSAQDSIDAITRVAVTLANADSHYSQLHRTTGLKGAVLHVSFVFADLALGAVKSEAMTLFRGICEPPEEITEETIRLSFTSRMSLQRILLPEVRIQRRCPWAFPSTAAQRQEAIDGGTRGEYSPFTRCGYSAGLADGLGNPGPAGAFSSCEYTRASCSERGMFSTDSNGNVTRRFGGVEFVPSTITVRSYGEKGSHLTSGIENESRYNDFVPLVYGTAWYRPPVVFARNDGNLTHTEVLLGMGPVSGVLKVLANGIELPAGNNAPNATATGWYNLASSGWRNGEFNLDFKNASGEPAGDPYGSMAVLSVVVPNRISDGGSLPRIDVLLNGLMLPVYNDGGEFVSRSFTRNPAWVLLDLLRRSGWTEADMDLASFGRVAAYCDEPIDTTDLNGAARQVPRFQCNLVVRQRRSAADVVRGVRNCAGLYLTYGPGGLLQLHAESDIAIQHSGKPEGSNSIESLNGGWPAYEFGDGSSPFSDILRRGNGEPAVRFWCRGSADSPNRFSVEFQDEFNEFQQDSLSLVDMDDAVGGGHEVSAALPALGVPNFNQAARILRLALDRSIRGNFYVEFEAGLRAIGLKPGDLITLSYAKEGLEREMFRILKIRPRLNYSSAVITAQLHRDEWYAGQAGLTGGGRQPTVEIGVPHPLVGVLLDSNGDSQFGVTESYLERSDGTWNVDLSVAFSPPARPGTTLSSVPLVNLAPAIETTGGTLAGGRSYYYAVSSVAEDGSESPLSFVVRAAVAAGTDANRVTLRQLSFAAGTSTFRVYRGMTPARLLRIATDCAVGDTFVDNGAQATAAAAPDGNYHHANFYWRMELLPETPVGLHSANTVGKAGLGLLPNEHRGKIVRIHDGKGRGQERSIASNDETTLTCAAPWTVEPDATSTFLIADSGWSFGAMSEGSPVSFAVPNRQKAVIQISGRSANVSDRECAYELSPLTRHTIGGAALDLDVPDAPIFGLTAAGRGCIEVAGIGFEDLVNTRSITAGTLMLHCWDELAGTSSIRLANDIAVDEESLILAAPAGVEPGVLVLIGTEVLVARTISSNGLTYTLERGAFGTTASGHTTSEPAYHLTRRVSVLPLVKGLFGSPASGSYSHSIEMPNQRVVAAELFVTNGKGNSQVAALAYSNTVDHGLRTLSGGQFTMQVSGELAVQSNAVPPCSIDRARAVRDVYASVTDAPDGASIVLQVTANGEPWCSLTIVSGQTLSTAVSGLDLPPLLSGTILGLDVISTGLAGSGRPGSGLTVTIRV
ncbi:MAG: phage tail protein [Bryobacteraceae bacterium]|nr:phage tail protein [Bryobacteraceae bacterium]